MLGRSPRPLLIELLRRKKDRFQNRGASTTLLAFSFGSSAVSLPFYRVFATATVSIPISFNVRFKAAFVRCVSVNNDKVKLFVRVFCVLLKLDCNFNDVLMMLSICKFFVVTVFCAKRDEDN